MFSFLFGGIGWLGYGGHKVANWWRDAKAMAQAKDDFLNGKDLTGLYLDSYGVTRNYEDGKRAYLDTDYAGHRIVVGEDRKSIIRRVYQLENERDAPRKRAMAIAEGKTAYVYDSNTARPTPKEPWIVTGQTYRDVQTGQYMHKRRNFIHDRFNILQIALYLDDETHLYLRYTDETREMLKHHSHIDISEEEYIKKLNDERIPKLKELHNAYLHARGAENHLVTSKKEWQYQWDNDRCVL